MLQYMLDTLVYILFKKLLTTGCDQGCHELLETCAMEIKRNETVWGGERLDEMKNSGMSETMRSLTRKSVCALLSLLLLLSAVLPVKAVAETAPIKIIRVGSFEDTFNYCNEKGARKGYGYELLQTLSGYTGWQFEYVTCDWSDCFEKLKNDEIDIMGGISYTEDRAEEMLFSDEPMGEEKYYLYVDLSRADISASNFKTLNGKKVGVLMGTEPEVMLTEWEEKYGLKTQHVNISNNEDVKQKLANHEIDCFVSLEESLWAELGISTITRVGKSSIYYVLNKDRSDLKEELVNAMRALDEAAPFYTADLCKKYFSLDYKPILTGEEKAWLRKHGAIRMGFLTSDRGVSTYDPATGEITGTITDYIQFATDYLGNQELEFHLVGYDDKEAELNALKSGEIDMVFHFDQSPNLAEEYRVACTNTTWTSNMMAVTNKQLFIENEVNRVAVPQNKISLTRYIAFYYPQWEIVDCDTQEDAIKLVKDGQADCFVTGISSEGNYSKKYGFYSVPLPNPANSCFAVNSGNRSLLSILNKTIKAMPANMLTSSLAMYKSSSRKVTLIDFIKDNFFMVLLVSSIAVAVVLLTILKLLQKARKAEAAARKAANDTQELNAKLQVAVENAESANRAKSTFLFNMSHDIRTPMNAIMGMTRIASENIGEPERVMDCLGKIEQASGHLLKLINEVLNMSKIESGRMELIEKPILIHSVVDNVLMLLQDNIEKKKMTLQVDMDRLPEESVYGDATRILEILLNLASNAVKYTPEGGTIRFLAEKREEIGSDQIYRFVVQDNGIGMSKEFLEKLFEPFVREQKVADGKFEGTGLGMSITKAFVEMMGGDIRVDSKEGEGTTFEVLLRFKKAEAAVTEERGKVWRLDECRGRFEQNRLLLAEDNELNREILKELIRETGISIEEAVNGTEAVRLVQNNPEDYFDLVFMDVQMPEMDGYEAAGQIRQYEKKLKRKHLPIIALTANVFAEDSERALRAGMDAHMGKPVDVPRLLATMMHWIG